MWTAVLYSLLGLFLLLLVVLLIPVFLQLDFSGEFSLRVRFLGIPVFRYSSDKPSGATGKADTKKEQDNAEPSLWDMVAQTLKTDGVTATVQYVQKGASLVTGTVRKVLRIVTLDKLIIKLTVASEDAAHTAQDTGKICAVLYPSITALQSVLKIKSREVTVTPDFLAEKGKAEVRLVAHAMLLRILWVGLGLIRQYSAWQTLINKENKEEISNGK